MTRERRGTRFRQAIAYGLVGILLQMPAACGDPQPQGGGDGARADHAGCALLEALLEDIDRGLAAVENGTAARRPTTSVTVFAQEALASGAEEPLPGAVEQALSNIISEASENYFFESAAEGFLDQGLIIKAALPKACPDSTAPDLERYKGAFEN